MTGVDGKVYGNTKDGDVFCIEDCRVTSFRAGDELGIEKVSTVFADPQKAGLIYFGTESDGLYCGSFDADASELKRISVSPGYSIYWMTYACGRLWVNTDAAAGYIENDVFHPLSIPMDESIEMVAADYQGNIWLASSKQGAMKVVANNFVNFSQKADLGEETINAVCRDNDGGLFIGTNHGLIILDKNNKKLENDVTRYLSGTRIRCIEKDGKGSVWISTYTNDLGLVCVSADGKITSFTTDNGMPHNKSRSISISKEGNILVGTNDGLAVIRDSKVIRTVGPENSDVIENKDFLTVAGGNEGVIYAGSDGDGIYMINPDDTVEKIGIEDGLTSNVILRIKWDRMYDVHWIITSNSIQYLKDGKIRQVKSFPYTNNFDIYFDANANAWVLSSAGVYCVKVTDMLNDSITPDNYKKYSHGNGLPFPPNANSYSELDPDGNLFIAGTNGVSVVNIYHYFEEGSKVKAVVKSVRFNDEEVVPADRTYSIKPGKGRIVINTAVMDYTMTDPIVHLYLEGADDGKTVPQSELTPLEQTDLDYGNYKLHIKIKDRTTGDIQDEVYTVIKKAHFYELRIVKVVLVILIALITGFLVWRILSGTVIRRQYEEVRAAKDEADRANGAKSRFLANMSHEIRTPINTIMGMDEMILREDATDVPKPYFMSVINYALDIRNASDSLLGLINNLLDMSRIESGKMTLVEHEYDTVQLLRSVITMIRVRSNEKDLAFSTDIDPNLPERMYGDSDKIKQVILNLLSNAVKYTNEGGFTLKVSVEDRQDDICSLRVSVKDTGIGIRPEDMDKLFSAYERLDEQKNAGTVGTGLGLDISRQFIELMDGRLWCESVYGEGSEFIFTIDQKTADDKTVGVFTEHDDNEARGPYVPQFIAPDAEVLVVDDNPMNLNVVKGLLKATKMFVTTASSGEECLEMLKYGKYNVVLLDHLMPGMDGVETLEKIRETHPDLPVYALTANATAGEDFYKAKGFNGYLAKPIDSALLERTIMRHLPPEMMMKPSQNDPYRNMTSLPEEYKWLEKVEEINVPDGLNNAGGVSSFIFALNLFADTAYENSFSIDAAYTAGDFKSYRTKVHALKNSARIIGAKKLFDNADKMERAIDNEDFDYIRANAMNLVQEYRSYKEKLAGLK
ncbi:MAG: response regulator [Lachnospiraceae bacterium]|nr:response regulator [Lachnospiraceae bacterium]